MSDLSAQLGLLYVYVRTEKFASNFCYEFVLNRDVDTSLPLISKATFDTVVNSNGPAA